MKKPAILAILLVGILAFNCKKDVTPTYTMTVSLTLPSGFNQGTIPDGTTVKLTETQTGRETILLTTGGNGTVSSILTEGNYNGNTSFTIKVGSDEYIFNGVVSNVILNKETSLSIPLVLAKNTGGFIIKEIYFTGSKTPDAKSYYSDQFHEIYNNSNDTLYADGLCIAFLEQTPSAPNVWVNTDGSALSSLPTTFQQWIIPGSGKEHPVLPGKSIVIAQDGIDHKTDPNGNSLSPVNLANAEWESYVAASGKDTDSPGVPNMTLMYTTSVSMVDWLHSVFGYAEIIFRLPVPWEQFVANPANFKTKPGSTSTTQYMMIPVSYVIDAVEVVYPDEAKRNKRLPATLDAGYTWIDGGTYCSKSIRRKAKMVVNGRVIYKDTNNSTNDFLHDLVPTPWVNPTSAEN